MFGPLVSTTWLHEHLNDPDLMIADVRWHIDNIDGGREAFAQSRIPNAIFFDLDRELSDQSDPKRGRHPLPTVEAFTSVLHSKGIGKDTKLIAYDDKGGSVAVRLWWMMRWLGFTSAAVLDGGIPRWIHDGYPLESSTPRKPKPAEITLSVQLHKELLADDRDVEAIRQSRTVLIDARAPERYRGEVEPIDLRAGHIPGAINIPYATNLTDETAPVFLPAEELREKFEQHGIFPTTEVICYCGSGVTACHNILALELAGIKSVRLYPGSWSEWLHYHT